MVDNMIGKRFGRLIVVDQYFERAGSTKKSLRDFCDCICDCGKEKKHILGANLRGCKTESCGCYRKDRTYEACHKVNEYREWDDDNMYGIDFKGNTFTFSSIDYELICDYCWMIDTTGYARTRINGETIFLHNLIFGNTGERIDHINRIRSDNRRENLRLASVQQNNINKGLGSNNTSGIIGVSKKSENSWHSYIANPETRKRINCYSKTFEDAVRIRLLLEKKYYKDFAPQKHLFEKYGIEE